MSKSPVSAYLQLEDTVDSFKPGDGKQLVDLDEYYQETSQPQIDAVVQGTESLALGKLSRSVAVQLNLPNTHLMDPFASERNAVMGAEGFFSTIVEGFRTFIENIIKYIRMACQWVIDTVKTIFGFKKSERIEKAIEAKQESLRDEFKTVLTGLGFPGADYNLEAFIGKFPPALGRMGQLNLMKSKFASDEEAIKALSASIPLLQQCVGKFNQASDKAIKSADFLKRTIREEFTKTRARAHLNETISGEESPEVNRVVKACMDTMASLQNDSLMIDVVKVLETIYNVKFENQALTEGFLEVRKRLDAQIVTEVAKVTPINFKAVMQEIAYLNKRYSEISDNSMDMSRVRIKELGDAIEVTDADKVKAIADHYGHPAPVSAYQQTAVAVRNFTNFCHAISRQLLVIDRQIYNLVSWHTRCHLWYYHGLLDDFEKLRQINQGARADGHNPVADAVGNPTYHMEFIDESDAKTFMEKFGVTARDVIQADIGGLKTTYNNFVKSSGWGKPA